VPGTALSVGIAETFWFSNSVYSHQFITAFT